jgi:hypothetical protein
MLFAVNEKKQLLKRLELRKPRRLRSTGMRFRAWDLAKEKRPRKG